VREVIELILEEEVEAALGASRSQRVAERSGYRHGAKPRRLTLRTGLMALRVPRARHLKFSYLGALSPLRDRTPLGGWRIVRR
jgi:transposase-like protein